VRHAMRLVHEAIVLVRSEQLEGPVYVCSSGAITTAHVIPALQELQRAHPKLVPTVQTVDPVKAVPSVLRGTADVIFHSMTLAHPDLVTIHLGDETCGIYCGPGHPLFRKRKVDLDTVVKHPFVAPPDAHGDTGEGWPPEINRRVAMRVDQMRVGCEVCASGALLAVLPDVIARSFALRRLPLELIPSRQLFATHRPPLEFETRADAVVAAVQRHLAR
jgi:DNA-binding transcriptional LysR family regulator